MFDDLDFHASDSPFIRNLAVAMPVWASCVSAAVSVIISSSDRNAGVMDTALPYHVLAASRKKAAAGT
jgi:hypothetical protein